MSYEKSRSLYLFTCVFSAQQKQYFSGSDQLRGQPLINHEFSPLNILCCALQVNKLQFFYKVTYCTETAMDESVEKPALTCRPCSEFLPMVLSKHGVLPVIQVPASIAQYLRAYQREGVRFLYKRFKIGEGGILADEMGLGKTIQAIAFIAAILQMKGTKEDKLRHCSDYIRNDIAPGFKVPSVNPVLIICPASLSDNWVDELETWGYFTVVKISSVNRSEVLSRAKCKEYDIVITTFESARASIDQLNCVDWSCILVDEVHRIKDSNSQVSKALNSLECRFRFGFTGTPFQNSFKETWCLLNWSNPVTLGNLAIRPEEISRVIELGNRSDATKGEITERNKARLIFRKGTSDLILRRDKDILGDILPPKTDQVVFCSLSAIQENIYRTITTSPGIQELLDSLKDKDKSCTGSMSKCMKNKTGLFTYLHILQKTANHVGLLASCLSLRSNENSRDICLKALESIDTLQEIPRKRWLEALSDIKMSGKMLVLSKLLPVFMERGDKILIFSYSTKVLDLVEKYLKKMRFKHWRLDGSTPADKRFASVKSFNKFPEPAIFLVSTKAGGVGLNMTGANVVIIYDPNWNPAHDLQAQDRAYRLGQERNVRVYRLLSTSTIEEFVYLRQVYKQQLESSTMTEENARRYFNSELFGIRNLFSFREGGRSLTEELLEKQKCLEERLRLKLAAPSREEKTKAHISPCAIDDKDHKRAKGTVTIKSGLAQLCEEVFKLRYEEPTVDDSDDWMEGEGEEDNGSGVVQEEGPQRTESISTFLERTGTVKHIIKHDGMVEPSSMEDFVKECAIRDVVVKGINSQQPAFDCSLGSEDDVIASTVNPKISPNHSRMCRLKFDEIAENEFLTPYKLAKRVMIMSMKEKSALLKKYSKRHHEGNLEKNMKRTRKSSETSLEIEDDAFDKSLRLAHKKNIITYCSETVVKAISNVKDEENIESIVKAQSPPDSQPICDGAGEPSGTVAETQSSCLDQSVTSSSSFEKDVSVVYPNISRGTLQFLKSYMENDVPRRPKSKGTEQAVTEKSESLKSNYTSCANVSVAKPKNNCQSGDSSNKIEMCAESSPKLEIDKETGMTAATVAYLDSLYFSKFVPKPSPKRASKHSSSMGEGQSTCSVSKVRSSPKCVETKNEGSVSVYRRLSIEIKPVSTNERESDSDLDLSPLYKTEDDIYQKLLNSGKLKLV